MHEFDEYVNENNIGKVLDKSNEKINADIEDQDKDTILGGQAFHLD